LIWDDNEEVIVKRRLWPKWAKVGKVAMQRTFF
jgi:hypothetical protein